MQIYQGLPVLTAQPPAADAARVPHRLYAALAPDDACTAARWRDMALAEIESVLAAGQLPVITGGTGLYINALVKGLSPIPAIDPALRDRLMEDIAATGNADFHRRLAEKDAVMAARLHPGNTQRVVRAMEVLLGTGRSLAHWQDIPPEGPPAHLRFVIALLLPPRDRLYAQCDARFLQMLDSGAIEEARAFRAQGYGAVPLAKALGYPEICDYLDGRITREEAMTRAQMLTRRYAKRQMTWFRGQMRADITLATPDAAPLLPLLAQG